MKYSITNSEELYYLINQKIDCCADKLRYIPTDVYLKFVEWDQKLYKEYNDLVKYLG